MTGDRRPEFQRPEGLEDSLYYFERLLGPLELREIEGIRHCNEPIVFLLGCPRSGTTLVYQYLSYSGLFSYPTNFVSRFYFAPYLGARLQEMLWSSNFLGELGPSDEAQRFRSTLGKTQGPLAPHEFWYFWRRFFKFGEIQKLSDDALSTAETDLFLRELRAFQSVAGKPLVMKAMILNWDIPFLAKLSPDFRFVFIERDLQSNATSLVEARKRHTGDENHWYSLKPPGYEGTLNLDPLRQTTWQVLATNSAIKRGLRELSSDRLIHIRYEEFCAAPDRLLKNIGRRFELDVSEASTALPASFTPTSPTAPSRPEWDSIVADARRLLEGG